MVFKSYGIKIWVEVSSVLSVSIFGVLVRQVSTQSISCQHRF